MNEVPLFIKKGAVLPLCQPALSVEDLERNNLQLIAYGDNAKFDMYIDDGISKQYSTDTTEIKVTNNTATCNSTELNLYVL